ncbi:MAG: hypothetical protein PHY95_05020 [Candidatus ainarchaeum sp.]|nr:hypothetical protein [Candidatus ainarchaeum sp.]
MESTAAAAVPGAEARRLASSMQAPARRRAGVVPFQENPLYLKKDFRKIIKAEIADVPDWDRDGVLDFIAKSPFAVDPEKWRLEDVPESRRDEIYSALVDFMFRVRLFKECLDRSQTPTIAEYAKNPDCKRVFDGCIVYLDLADSSKLSRELSPAQLRDLIENVFHEFILAATGPFRFMKDVVVGDAVSGAIMAPVGNKRVSAIEGARLLLTIYKLFEQYNKIVENMDRATGERHYPLKIRGALASGRVEIMTSDLASEMVCRLMNLVARMSGIPGKMELIVNKEAKEFLETFFNFREVRTIDVLHEEIARLKKELDSLPEDGNDKTLLKRLEMHYRLSRLYEVLYKVFELPNHDASSTGTPYLTAFEEHRSAYQTLRDKNDLYQRPELQMAADGMVREADKEYYSEKFQQITSKHLKGFKAEDYQNMYVLEGYKAFSEDELVNPKGSLFRELYLDEVSAGQAPDKGAKMGRIERFVDRVAAENHVSLKLDLDIGASYYVMTTVQPSGSPDFAYQQACRAVGMALYGIERMKKAWGHQSSGFIGRVQEDLVKRGVFNGDGEVDKEKLSEYLEEAIVLPCLLREVSQVHVCRRNGNRGSVNMVGQILAMHRGDIINEDEKERVLHLNAGSAEELEAANERMKEEYKDKVGNFYPPRTIAVIRNLDYSARWEDIELQLGSADAFAAEFCLIAGMTQARLKPKTYRYASMEPAEWGERMFRDIDENNGNIHPFVRATCRELFSVRNGQKAA